MTSNGCKRTRIKKTTIAHQTTIKDYKNNKNWIKIKKIFKKKNGKEKNWCC